MDRLHHFATRMSSHTDDTDQHKAAVDLLVLTVYCNGNVSQEELDGLDRFDADHTDWDSGAFSVSQYLPEAVSRVRRDLEQPGGEQALLREAASRITTPALRDETGTACTALAASDGTDEKETAFLVRLRQALGTTG